MKLPTPEQTNFILKCCYEHLKEGGSFRYLIYNRIGYTLKDYTKLQNGLNFSNLANKFHDDRPTNQTIEII